MSKADFERAKELYPSCAMDHEQWLAVLDANPDIVWAIVGDIYDAVKTEQERDAGIRRMGRRPARTATSMADVYATVFPPQYSTDPFTVAFASLIKGRSQRQVAMRIPCTQSTVSRLLAGQLTPDLRMLERIAETCKVPAHYFTEYRAHLIGQTITQLYLEQPHKGITAMKKLRAGRWAS